MFTSQDFMEEPLSDIEPGRLLYVVPECNHLFDVGAFDRYMLDEKVQSNKGHVSFKAKSCPKCSNEIRYSFRYGNVIKKRKNLLLKLKKKYIAEAKEFERKREEARRKKNLELAKEILAIVRKAEKLSMNRTYVCPNGHPYFIADCGGAMEESKCPDCGAKVGGTSHRLVSGNRAATEFGSPGPAWPQ